MEDNCPIHKKDLKGLEDPKRKHPIPITEGIWSENSGRITIPRYINQLLKHYLLIEMDSITTYLATRHLPHYQNQRKKKLTPPNLSPLKKRKQGGQVYLQ